MQGTIRVLGRDGDTAVEYDTDSGVVAEAEEVLRQAARTASALFDGTTKEQIPHISGLYEPGTILSEHEEVLVVPPMAGG